jgi:hypothetical protein
VAPHVDVILPYLQHEEWWLRNAAIEAVTPIVNDDRCYQKVLPAMGRMLERNHLFNATSPLRWGGMAEALRQAPPHVAKLARQELREAYTEYVEFDHEVPSVEARVNPTMRSEIASALVQAARRVRRALRGRPASTTRARRCPTRTSTSKPTWRSSAPSSGQAVGEDHRGPG